MNDVKELLFRDTDLATYTAGPQSPARSVEVRTMIEQIKRELKDILAIVKKDKQLTSPTQVGYLFALPTGMAKVLEDAVNKQSATTIQLIRTIVASEGGAQANVSWIKGGKTYKDGGQHVLITSGSLKCPIPVTPLILKNRQGVEFKVIGIHTATGGVSAYQNPHLTKVTVDGRKVLDSNYGIFNTFADYTLFAPTSSLDLLVPGTYLLKASDNVPFLTSCGLLEVFSGYTRYTKELQEATLAKITLTTFITTILNAVLTLPQKQLELVQNTSNKLKMAILVSLIDAHYNSPLLGTKTRSIATNSISQDLIDRYNVLSTSEPLFYHPDNAKQRHTALVRVMTSGSKLVVTRVT